MSNCVQINWYEQMDTQIAISSYVQINDMSKWLHKLYEQLCTNKLLWANGYNNCYEQLCANKLLWSNWYEQMCAKYYEQMCTNWYKQMYTNCYAQLCT